MRSSSVHFCSYRLLNIGISHKVGFGREHAKLVEDMYKAMHTSVGSELN